ncbi:MAG: ROK family protein [Limnobaculum xujianqingii]
MSPNVPNTLRLMNKSLVLNVIREHTPLSRAQIAKISGITKATISEIVTELLDEKIIYESGMTEGGLGRKGVMVNFDANHGVGVGIDLGGTKISLSLFNLNAELLATAQTETYKVATRAEFLQHFNHAIRQFLNKHAVSADKLKVIGIATPGIVDYHHGIVLEGSPNLPEWENIPLADEVSAVFKVPVVLENDIRSALIGEMLRGKCQRVHSAALIGVGTGLGAALLMDGKIIRGANNAAGEIGYMMFSREHLSHNWRNKGCFEVHASGSGISQRYQELSGQDLSAEEISKLAQQGDPLAESLFRELADYLAIGILNIVAIANPEKIILTGGVTQSAPQFLPYIQAHINQHTFSQTLIQIEQSELGTQAPLYGIAVLALNQVYPSIQFMSDAQLS